MLAAQRADERPTDVAAKSPFTEAYVRKLARENGIPEYLLRRYPKARAELESRLPGWRTRRRRSAAWASAWITPSTSAACCGTA